MAEGNGLNGDLTVAAVSWTGEGRLDAANASLYAPRSLDDPIEARFTIHAEKATVHWTRVESASLLSPTSPGSSPVSVAKGPAATGERSHADADIEAASWAANANWLLVTEADGRLGMPADHGEARAAENETWRVGRQATSTNPAARPSVSFTHHPVPGSPLLNAHAAGPISFHGDAWLYVWGLNATVADGRGERFAYASGSWSSNSTGTTRDDYEQLLAIHLVNASLLLRDVHGALRASGPIALALGSVHASLEEATGRIELGSGLVSLSRQQVDLSGSMALNLAAATDPRRISAHVDGDLSAARVDGTPWLLESKATVARSNLPLVVGLLLAVALLGALGAWGAIALRRRSPLALAEDEIIQGRPARAARRLRRWLGQQPRDAHAWFLLGATFLKENDPRRVVSEIEPVARRLDIVSRTSLAFILALAYARLLDPEHTLEWLSWAIRDPDFRDRAAVEPDFALVAEDARFHRLVGGEAAAYG